MHGQARNAEERAERERETTADQRYDPDDGWNGGLGSQQPLLSCVPEPRQGPQQQRMQIAVGYPRGLEGDSCPVQLLEERRAGAPGTRSCSASSKAFPMSRMTTRSTPAAEPSKCSTHQ